MDGCIILAEQLKRRQNGLKNRQITVELAGLNSHIECKRNAPENLKKKKENKMNMKRAISILLLFVPFLYISAQEKPLKGTAETSFGWSKFGNISNPSLFAEGSGPMDMIPSAYMKLGYNGWTVSWGYNILNTLADAYNETVLRNVIMIGIDKMYPIDDKWIFMYSLEAGLLIQRNSYIHQESGHVVNQYGPAGHIGVSMNYMLTKYHYAGLRCNVLDFGLPSGKTEALPSGLTTNPRAGRAMFGTGLMFVLGYRF